MLQTGNQLLVMDTVNLIIVTNFWSEQSMCSEMLEIVRTLIKTFNINSTLLGQGGGKSGPGTVMSAVVRACGPPSTGRYAYVFYCF